MRKMFFECNLNVYRLHELVVLLDRSEQTILRVLMGGDDSGKLLVPECFSFKVVVPPAELNTVCSWCEGEIKGSETELIYVERHPGADDEHRYCQSCASALMDCQVRCVDLRSVYAAIGEVAESLREPLEVVQAILEDGYTE